LETTIEPPKRKDTEIAVRSKRISSGPREFDSLSNIEEYQNEELEKQRKFVLEIIAKGQPWQDPDFKPEISSLFDPAHDEGNIEDF
jgi:hypothetical protein